jgi:GSH-dependent disulfide-bond oxidoreductase
MIELYTASTPNGQKIAIMLEETGLPYTAHKIDLAKGEQKKPEFLKINPNGKIPVMVDGDAGVTLSESGAILVYLAEKSGQFLPADHAGRFAALQWVFFQMSAIGPMLGQLWHFVDLEPQIHYSTRRYRNEAARIVKLVEARLAEAKYLAGEAYSIADIATWPWLRNVPALDMDTEAYPSLQRWLAEIATRPAVKRGMAVAR